MSEMLSHSENNEAVLRELVLRLATFPGDPRTRDPQLLLGQIPEDLPFLMVLPEGSQILGSLIPTGCATRLMKLHFQGSNHLYERSEQKPFH